MLLCVHFLKALDVRDDQDSELALLLSPPVFACTAHHNSFEETSSSDRRFSLRRRRFGHPNAAHDVVALKGHNIPPTALHGISTPALRNFYVA